MKKLSLNVLIGCLSFSMIQSCKKEEFVASGSGLGDWTTATHSNSVSPNYDVVFNTNAVNRIDIVISEENWDVMENNLTDLMNQTTTPGSFSDESPVYVPCDFYFNNAQWYNVGVRYKGNSSLYSAFRDGIGKLPLRFEFDQFEDDYPEIHNQRFYGFKEITMSSNFKDESFMRESSATDLFRDFGVPAARTAFYEVYVDYGDGSVYFGLYTMVEVIFDSFLNDWFGSESGNCYKPDGDGAKFSSSDFNLDDFDKKTNKESTDRSDIQAMYTALQATTRTSDINQYKSDLEALFDVDGFMKYLAVNNTIRNWDTYGNMTHNYYLYHDPADDLIKWIVWDNNEAFTNGVGNRNALSFEMNEVSTEWPLISYLINIPEYKTIYDNYLDSFIHSTFTNANTDNLFSTQSALISNSAAAETSGYTFLSNANSHNTAVSEIKTFCTNRVTAAELYLP